MQAALSLTALMTPRTTAMTMMMTTMTTMMLLRLRLKGCMTRQSLRTWVSQIGMSRSIKKSRYIYLYIECSVYTMERIFWWVCELGLVFDSLLFNSNIHMYCHWGCDCMLCSGYIWPVFKFYVNLHILRKWMVHTLICFNFSRKF